MEPLLSIDSAEVLYDGTLGQVRLSHPEGVAVHPRDGSVWCGGDRGEVYRIEPDGSSLEVIAATGGFVLGLAFDATANLFLCDLGHAAVFRLDARTGELDTFANGGGGRKMRIPNFPVVDEQRGCLYVSDSHGQGDPGPGVWRFDLQTGEGALWYGGTMDFANGMALSPDGELLYVVETFAHRVVRFRILADGSPGAPEPFVEGIHRLPDGLAFDEEGNLYVACYEPSRVYRVRPDGATDLLIEDLDAHTLCHPTNVAFSGTRMLCANLGRWHITEVDAGTRGLPLPVAAHAG